MRGDDEMMSLEPKPVEILLVEDNPVDVLVTRHALQEGRVCNSLSVVQDGEEAMEFLRRQGSYATAPVPDLILLDLNLPKKSGREVLAEIKQDPNLLHIPVIVLTTSEAEKDILASYKLHANCFITKPVDLDQFMAVVKSVEGFWFAVVRLAGGGQ
jgi:two-component system, chemotaxis family, response regulator Rcp1